MASASQIMIECIRSVDLRTPGVPRAIDNCIQKCRQLSFERIPILCLSAVSLESEVEDDRWWILVALLFEELRIEGSEDVLIEIAHLFKRSHTDLLPESLVRLLEYCWFDSGDKDAIEYHYWACLQLKTNYPAVAQSVITDRLTLQNDIAKRCSLINAIGVLAHAPMLHYLNPTTVAIVIDIYNSMNESACVRLVAKEVLVEDILRSDQEHAFLIASHRMLLAQIALS